jgi:hypothetical protein
LSPQKENKFLQSVASQTNDDWLMFGTNKFREKPGDYSNVINDDDVAEDNHQEERIEVEIENDFDEDDDDEEGLSQDIDIEVGIFINQFTNEKINTFYIGNRR